MSYFTFTFNCWYKYYFYYLQPFVSIEISTAESLLAYVSYAALLGEGGASGDGELVVVAVVEVVVAVVVVVVAVVVVEVVVVVV